MEEERVFQSSQEEAAYWKQLAQQYKHGLEEAREELDEFQVGSRELEAELEAQLEQAEVKNRELSSNNSRLTMDLDIAREKLEQLQTRNHRQLAELEGELSQVKAYKEQLHKYVRELEQINDDLERAKRTTLVSLEDFEGRLNQAIERNAFLENELEERDMLAVSVQRLKDETRDLKQELSVNKREVLSPKEPKTLELEKPVVIKEEPMDSNKLTDVRHNSDFITPTNTPIRSQVLNQSNGTPLTPSARISALNIVGDLLRKVGALESKLASCRNFAKETPVRKQPGTGNSPLHSPRAKRLHSAASVPAPTAALPQGYMQFEA